MSAEATSKRIDGYKRTKTPPVPGTGPIKSMTVYGCNIIAIRNDENGTPRSWIPGPNGWEELK